MKQKMKRLISVAALAVMLVSLFSAWVLPASALSNDDYIVLLNGAYVVNHAWAGTQEGAAISFTYRGETVEDLFDSHYHFADLQSAYTAALGDGVAAPVILLCAGTYTGKLEITSGLTLLGPNAGIDPVVKSESKTRAWSLSTARIAEATLNATLVVKKEAGAGALTFDGVKFGSTGGLLDVQRSSGASTLTFRNTVFDNAGNADTFNYPLYLYSTGHARTLRFENDYITGISKEKTSANTVLEQGFISPYFTNLYAENIAYVNSANGFLAQTIFESGVSPSIEIASSNFFNTSADMAQGYAISMDNAASSPTFNYSNNTWQLPNIITSDLRKRSSLKIHDSVFYNASKRAANAGVIHFELVNNNSVIELNNNYFRSDVATAVIMPEYLVDSVNVNQTNCFLIRNNALIGTYRIPSVKGANNSTYIDMTDNYFGTVAGIAVNKPVYVDESFARLIRNSFWVDEEMTHSNTEWQLNITHWPLAWTDNFSYSAEMIVYNTGSSEIAAQFEAMGEGRVELFANAKLDSDGIITSVSSPISQLTTAHLNTNPYEKTTIYARITIDDVPYFTPVYTIEIQNVGDISDKPEFSEAFGKGWYMYQPSVKDSVQGSMVPYRWRGEIYKMTVGETIFPTVKAAIDYANAQGVEVPTIVVPAGIYTEEMIITGSCTILGEQYGVNPNKKVYEYIPREGLGNSVWTLNPARAKGYESDFWAVIRVAAAADDFVITVDGIKMSDGCSYVDDEARHCNNVTILKNIYALDAGGGLDRTGATNGQLFRFWKAWGVGDDRNTTYMYDIRVENTGIAKSNMFAPYFEKLVVDGMFIGSLQTDNATGGKNLFQSFRSRDVEDPYYSFTNCYFNNNPTTPSTGCVRMTSQYYFNTADADGSQEIKKNIVYNFDNVVFNQCFPTGYGGMMIRFTGTNMTFNFTNNILWNTDADSFIAGTTGNKAFMGNCPQNDVSSMIVLRRNRLLGKNRLPLTVNVGNGTEFDFSGNYFSTASGTQGLLPGTPGNSTAYALRFQYNETNVPDGFTFAELTRIRMDYTYLDWDLTIRSDVGADGGDPEYTLSNGIYGTGTYAEEAVSGENVMVYRDTVPADCSVYTAPYSLGEGSVATIYTRPAMLEEDSIASLALDPSKAENTFYVQVKKQGSSKVLKLMIVLTRLPNSEAKLLAVPNGLIDEEAATVNAFIDRTLVNINTHILSGLEYSIGASAALYANAACTQAAAKTFSLASGPQTFYLKIVSEDGSNEKVYCYTITKASAATMQEAGVLSVFDMEPNGTTAFETTVSAATENILFKPELLLGTTIAVYDGNKELLPDADGVYLLKNSGANTQTVTILATSGDGSSTKAYTLTFYKGQASECELLGIAGATEGNGQYTLLMGAAEEVALKATVSDGAYYEVFSDYACTEPCEGNRVRLIGTNTGYAYIRVTAEDGSASSIHKITLISEADSVVKPIITADCGGSRYTAVMTGKDEYTIYLPAGAKEVELSGSYAESSDARLFDIYMDAARTYTLSSKKVNLEQRITRVFARMGLTSRPIELEEGVMGNATIPEKDIMVYLVSDRTATSYSDAAAIADWAKPYINYLNNGKYGILKGDNNNNVNASSNITRYEIATIACRVLGVDTANFSSVSLNYKDSVASWALPYVKAVAGLGIMNGALNVATGEVFFYGTQNATREQVAKILVNIALISEGITMDPAEYYTAHKMDVDAYYLLNCSFADEKDISDWAIPYMHMAVSKYKMMAGTIGSNGQMYLFPKRNITRAEVAKMVACYLGYES